MGIISDANLSLTKADIIASLVLKELAFKSALKPLVTDYSMLAVKGAKSVKLPSFDSFTAGTRASGVAGVPSVLTNTIDTINLDQLNYLSWIIDSNDELQSSVAVQQVAAERAAAALARAVDSAIIAKLEAGAGYNQGVAVTVTRDILLDMREALLSKNADPMNMQILVGPEQEKALLKIAEFTNQYQFGAGAPLNTGVIGKVFGVPVIMHNGVGTGKAYMFDKAGIALAFQQQPKYAEQPAVDYGTGAKLAAIDMVWGLGTCYTAQFGAAAGTSPLIAKM
jgi:hypothetical protein